MKPGQPADRAEIQRRLEDTRAGLASGFTPSPEDDRLVLKKRAQKLARELEAEAGRESFLEVVEFDLASERYAFPLTEVRAVSLLRDLTPVPCTPAFVLGIINLRGEICTVIDLKKFFDLPAAGLTELNKIILLRHEKMQLGILADAIRGVRRIRLDELQPALPTLTGIGADYVRGVTGDRLVLLETARLLSDKRILVDEEVS